MGTSQPEPMPRRLDPSSFHQRRHSLARSVPPPSWLAAAARSSLSPSWSGEAGEKMTDSVTFHSFVPDDGRRTNGRGKAKGGRGEGKWRAHLTVPIPCVTASFVARKHDGKNKACTPAGRFGARLHQCILAIDLHFTSIGPSPPNAPTPKCCEVECRTRRAGCRH